MNILESSTPGSRIGSSVGKGIQNLIDYKVNQMNERTNVSRIESMGISRPDAEFISTLPINQQEQAVRYLLGNTPTSNVNPSQIPSQEQTRMSAAPNTQMSQPQQSPLYQQEMGSRTALKNILDALGSGQHPKTAQDVATRALFGNNPIIPFQAPEEQRVEPKISLPKQQVASQQPQVAQKLPVAPPLESPKEQIDKASYRNAAKNATRNSNQDNVFQEPETREEAKAARVEYQALKDAKKGAKDVLTGIRRMRYLNEKGDLNHPLKAAVVEFIGQGGKGLNLSSLLTPNSNEMLKIETGFLKNAKRYFGSRMTEGELKLFLKTFPSLTQDKESRSQLIDSLELFAEGEAIRGEIAEQIVEQNGGRIPRNIDRLVDVIGKDQLDALVDKIINRSESVVSDQKKERIFENLPDAKNYEGKTFMDENGQKRKSINGQWVTV